MSRIRSLVPLVTALALGGCYSYRAAALAQLQPRDDVRVTTHDGRRTDLIQTAVRGDTLHGISVHPGLLRERRVPVAIPIRDVSHVRVRRPVVGWLVEAGAGFAAVATGTAIFLAIICDSEGWC